jgi:hypothetical protein
MWKEISEDEYNEMVGIPGIVLDMRITYYFDPVATAKAQEALGRKAITQRGNGVKKSIGTRTASTVLRLSPHCDRNGLTAHQAPAREHLKAILADGLEMRSDRLGGELGKRMGIPQGNASYYVGAMLSLGVLEHANG